MITIQDISPELRAQLAGAVTAISAADGDCYVVLEMSVIKHHTSIAFTWKAYTENHGHTAATETPQEAFDAMLRMTNDLDVLVARAAEMEKEASSIRARIRIIRGAP